MNSIITDQGRIILLEAEIGLMAEALSAAARLLMKLDRMTTEQFSIGGEREEREALRAALESCGHAVI